MYENSIRSSVPYCRISKITLVRIPAYRGQKECDICDSCSLIRYERLTHTSGCPLFSQIEQQDRSLNKSKQTALIRLLAVAHWVILSYDYRSRWELSQSYLHLKKIDFIISYPYNTNTCSINLRNWLKLNGIISQKPN